jgi:hypothetical protein
MGTRYPPETRRVWYRYEFLPVGMGMGINFYLQRLCSRAGNCSTRPEPDPLPSLHGALQACTYAWRSRVSEFVTTMREDGWMYNYMWMLDRPENEQYLMWQRLRWQPNHQDSILGSPGFILFTNLIVIIQIVVSSLYRCWVWTLTSILINSLIESQPVKDFFFWLDRLTSMPCTRRCKHSLLEIWLVVMGMVVAWWGCTTWSSTQMNPIRCQSRTCLGHVWIHWVFIKTGF